VGIGGFAAAWRGANPTGDARHRAKLWLRASLTLRANPYPHAIGKASLLLTKRDTAGERRRIALPRGNLESNQVDGSGLFAWQEKNLGSCGSVTGCPTAAPLREASIRQSLNKAST
jgi:hypothetical protein